MNKFCILLCFHVSLFGSVSWENIESEQKLNIGQWLFSSSRYILNGESIPKSDLFIPEINSGLFITVILDKKVRGCYGAFYHDSNDPKFLIEKYLRGALRSDPRYKPLSLEEIDKMHIILTFASEPESVDDIYSINTEEYGIMAEAGTFVYILVPAELKLREQVAYFVNRIKAERIYRFKSYTLYFTQVQ